MRPAGTSPAPRVTESSVAENRPVPLRFETEPMGDAGLLVTVPEGQAPEAYRRLAAAGLSGVRDVVPAARSVLVVFEDGETVDEGALASALSGEAPAGEERARVVEVPVRYDGADLADAARRAGLTPAEFAARHASAEYVVAFVGFRPGFPYLRGLPPELATPRLATPRPRVPAGSVAIGAGWSGIYPAATPGGWNLIGTTDLVLFDAARTPPALFAPGDRVRFVRA